jgi:hypothetical protein
VPAILIGYGIEGGGKRAIAHRFEDLSSDERCPVRDSKGAESFVRGEVPDMRFCHERRSR